MDGDRDRLSGSAKALRAVHAVIAAAGLTCLGYLWLCAVTGRRDRKLAVALAALSAQGVGMVIGRGSCPLGPIQRRLGDPVPFFELLLPRRAAKAAFPVLASLAVTGFALLVGRAWASGCRSGGKPFV